MDEYIAKLLSKKLSGETTKAEWRYICEWMESHPDDCLVSEILNDVQITTSPNDQKKVDTKQWAEEAWKTLAEHLKDMPEKK